MEDLGPVACHRFCRRKPASAASTLTQVNISQSNLYSEASGLGNLHRNEQLTDWKGHCTNGVDFEKVRTAARDSAHANEPTTNRLSDCFRYACVLVVRLLPGGCGQSRSEEHTS